MGRPGSTKPFAPEELAQLAAVTSNKFEPRPTSKLSRDEILGLVAQTVSPGAAAPVDAVPPVPAPPVEEPRLAESSAEQPPLARPEPDESRFEERPTVAFDAVRRTEPVRPTVRSTSTGFRVVLLAGVVLAIAATVTAFAL